jgi:hypothetical protein
MRFAQIRVKADYWSLITMLATYASERSLVIPNHIVVSWKQATKETQLPGPEA